MAIGGQYLCFFTIRIKWIKWESCQLFRWLFFTNGYTSPSTKFFMTKDYVFIFFTITAFLLILLGRDYLVLAHYFYNLLNITYDFSSCSVLYSSSHVYVIWVHWPPILTSLVLRQWYDDVPLCTHDFTCLYYNSFLMIIGIICPWNYLTDNLLCRAFLYTTGRDLSFEVEWAEDFTPETGDKHARMLSDNFWGWAKVFLFVWPFLRHKFYVCISVRI